MWHQHFLCLNQLLNTKFNSYAWNGLNITTISKNNDASAIWAKSRSNSVEFGNVSSCKKRYWDVMCVSFSFISCYEKYLLIQDDRFKWIEYLIKVVSPMIFCVNDKYMQKRKGIILLQISIIITLTSSFGWKQTRWKYINIKDIKWNMIYSWKYKLIKNLRVCAFF